MKIHASAEDYLERILMLSEEKNEVHAIDIVRSMSFSKPSISIAMKKLVEQKLIFIDEYQHIHLTDEGHKIASKIYERHQVITKALTMLGVDEEIAKSDACKLEHDLSEESYQAIKEHLKIKAAK